MTKEKKDHTLRNGILTVLLVLLFVIGMSLFSGIGGRTYSVVTNYDLMVQEVTKGDGAIRMVPMDAMPEGEYYYHVTYAGKWPGGPAEGYLIAPKRSDGIVGEGYRVQCHPADEYDLEPNITFLDMPMYLGETDPEDIKDGFWVKQLIFELDGYCYRVRFESRHGMVWNVQPTLEKITRALLGEEVSLEGIWEHEVTWNVLGVGVEEPVQLTDTQRFEFRKDGTGVITTEFGDDHPTPPDIHFRYTLEDGIVTLHRKDGGSKMVFAVTYRDDSVQLDNPRGTFDLTRVG